jgi:hypothetical protein
MDTIMKWVKDRALDVWDNQVFRIVSAVALVVLLFITFK